MDDTAHQLSSVERKLLASAVSPKLELMELMRPIPGQDNTIAVVNGRWVVRVARTDDARSCHENEVTVLSALPDHCRAPRLVGAMHHGIVYEYIRGSRLTRDTWNSLPQASQQAVANDIKTVLNALHALPSSMLPDPAQLLDREWILTSIAQCAATTARAPLGFDTSKLAERFEHAWSLADTPSTVIHVDLKPDNLIVEGSRASVIDFGGVCVGDPAIDYGVLRHHFGESLLNAMSISSSPLAARARCFADLYHLRRCTRGWTRSP